MEILSNKETLAKFVEKIQTEINEKINVSKKKKKVHNQPIKYLCQYWHKRNKIKTTNTVHV